MPPSTLKVLIVGPKEGGKTAISNFLSDNTDRLGNQDKYQPTIGVRILECEKSNGRTQANVELWDCSGDQIYEACWPAILKDANATVIVYNPESHVHESEVTLWYEWFVQNAALDQAQCLVLAHTPGKSTASRGKVNLPPTLKTVQTTYESPGLLKAEFEAFLFSMVLVHPPAVIKRKTVCSTIKSKSLNSSSETAALTLVWSHTGDDGSSSELLASDITSDMFSDVPSAFSTGRVLTI
ncbi:hypothetical protein LEN26_017276 [Aphanomyces euteiches]|nr:hypothetical protein LEN26_017276 [Aphanomyces euteiches]KAH9112233.1 hypothetical protein AeMF1_013408 [Aphanomyces euteiches]KAH9187247.1 hypothetical protein AeNC1_010779 [Aphanomyces euteiches]